MTAPILIFIINNLFSPNHLNSIKAFTIYDNLQFSEQILLRTALLKAAEIPVVCFLGALEKREILTRFWPWFVLLYADVEDEDSSLLEEEPRVSCLKNSRLF